MIRSLRLSLSLLFLAVLAACGAPTDLSEPLEPLGDFRLGYNIVVAKNATSAGPLSRKATPEEWESLLKQTIQDRLGRYEGSRLYHLGVNVDGYILAVPGVPVVASPKSGLVITVNVWDDAKGKKINEPKQITVLEQLSGETIVGSGLTQSRETQMQNLALNAAQAIENYLRRNPQWFEAGADAAPHPATAPGPGEAAGALATSN